MESAERSSEVVPLCQLCGQRPGRDRVAEGRNDAGEEFEIRAARSTFARIRRPPRRPGRSRCGRNSWRKPPRRARAPLPRPRGRDCEARPPRRHGGRSLGMDVGSDRREGGEADAEPPRLAFHQFGVGRLGRGDDKRVARLGAREKIKRCGRVADAARNDALGAGAEPHLAEGRAERDATARGLEPEQSTARRGDANRSAGVVGCRHRNDARGHSGARAPARAAGVRSRSHGLLARPEQNEVGHALHSEFRQVGLAEHDEPRLEIAAHDVGVLARNRRQQRTTGLGGRQAGVVVQSVLDEERHAGERTRERPCELGARLLVHEPADGVDFRLDARVLRQRDLDQLRGADLATRDEVGEPDGVVGQIVGELHAVPPCDSLRSAMARRASGRHRVEASPQGDRTSEQGQKPGEVGFVPTGSLELSAE